MRFLWPDMLWTLLLVPALLAAYIYVLRRRKTAAIRYASLVLVRDAIGPRQRFRRHVPFALFLMAMLVALLALARPTTVLTLPAQYMTLMLSIDVSRSMMATDVKPNRMVAAQEAARTFINGLPRNVRLGIVSFAGTAALVQSPTDVREEMLAAIDRFQLQRATATGSGLLLALSTMFPDDGIDLEEAIFGQGFSSGYGGFGGAAPIDRERRNDKPKREITPVQPGSYTGGAIVLLSDGRRTTGPDPLVAARMAADRGVRVYTVGFGTSDGAAITGFGGWSFYARLDEQTLKAVANITGADYFHAGTAEDLAKVYQSLSTKFALERRETEVSSLFGALAALFCVFAALFSLLWFRRL